MMLIKIHYTLGMEVSSNKYVSVMTDAEPSASELLKIMRCRCNGSCGESVLVETHGITCTNVPEIEPEENQMNLQRSFLDASEIYYYILLLNLQLKWTLIIFNAF